MGSNRERAKRLMSHYIAMLMQDANFRVDGDTFSELDELVDCLIDAAKEEVRAETVTATKDQENARGTNVGHYVPTREDWHAHLDAGWIATDLDGRVYYFTGDRPVRGDCVWIPFNGSGRKFTSIESTEGWRQSLYSRPEEI